MSTYFVLVALFALPPPEARGIASIAGAAHASQTAQAVSTQSDAQMDRDPVWLSVTPAACVSPCAVLARAIIASHSGNRRLTLTADSLQYRRSTTAFLKGELSARAHQMLFKLPVPGHYIIEARLARSDGRVIVVQHNVEVLGGRMQ